MACKTKYIMTDAIAQMLRERYDGTSATAEALAAELGWPKHQVYLKARQLGLTRRGRNDTHDFTEADWALFGELYDGSAASVAEIKRQLNWDATEGTVRAWAGRRGFTDKANVARRAHARKITASAHDREIIERMWHSYDAIPEILEALPHLNQNAVIRAATAMGISGRGRHRSRKKRRKYHPTPEDLAIIEREYDGRRGCTDRVVALLGHRYPGWWVKRQARDMGLSGRCELNQGPGKTWSEAEEQALVRLYPLLPISGVRDELKKINGGIARTDVAIRAKAKRLAVNKRSRGFSMRQVCALLGVDHRVVRRWVEDGLLVGQRKGTARDDRSGGDMWHFEDDYIRVFIINHYDLIDFRKVEKKGFVQILTGGARPVSRAQQSDAVPDPTPVIDGVPVKRLPARSGRDGQRRRPRYSNTRTKYDDLYEPVKVH